MRVRVKRGTKIQNGYIQRSLLITLAHAIFPFTKTGRRWQQQQQQRQQYPYGLCAVDSIEIVSCHSFLPFFLLKFQFRFYSSVIVYSVLTKQLKCKLLRVFMCNSSKRYSIEMKTRRNKKNSNNNISNSNMV